MTTLGEAFSWSPMTPEQQKRKLNLAVSAIMKALSLPEAQKPDVRSAYVIAEDLALRHIEINQQMPFMRHVVLEGVPFDGVAVKDKQLYCAEVEFLTTPVFPPERFAAIFDKIDYAKQRVHLTRPDVKVILMIILVTQLQPGEDDFHKNLRKEIVEHAPVEVIAPILNFEQLQHSFLNE